MVLIKMGDMEDMACFGVDYDMGDGLPELGDDPWAALEEIMSSMLEEPPWVCASFTSFFCILCERKHT